MLATTFALYDVDDCVAFVAATIRRTGLSVGEAEHEELMLEGLAILCDLAARFTPRREGYTQDGWFSGYAARYLPRRLGDAWHRLHPEHRYVTDPDTGKRHWRYGKPAISLDALTDGGGSTDSYAPNALDRALSRARRLRDFTPIALSTAAS